MSEYIADIKTLLEENGYTASDFSTTLEELNRVEFPAVFFSSTFRALLAKISARFSGQVLVTDGNGSWSIRPNLGTNTGYHQRFGKDWS